MSIKKSLIALAAMALVLMGLASSAMGATDGVVRDKDGTVIGTKTLHLVGWAKFLNENGDGVECHSTSNLSTEAIAGGKTGKATFTVPNVANCAGKGLLAGCTVTAVTATNTPYHVTVTPTDFDVTGTIKIDNSLTGFLCPTSIELTFSEITVTPLGTVSKHAATNTAGNLGTTANAGEEISGAELAGTGESHSSLGTEQITASGELEIQGTDRCTYRIASS